MRARLQLLTSIAMAALLSSCSHQPRVDNQVHGLVHDLYGAPLEGATVTLRGLPIENDEDTGVETTTTDADGRYRFITNAIGTLPISVEMEGYARVEMTVATVDPPDTDDGDFDGSVVRNFQMYATNGSVYGRLFRNLDPRGPISGAMVNVQVNAGGIVDSSLPTSATTNENGEFEIAGLPVGISVRLFAGAIDVDDDGVMDTAGFDEYVSVLGEGARADFDLGAFEGLRVLSTNVDNTLVAVSDDLSVRYNLPMDTTPSTTQVTLQQTSPESFSAGQTHNFSEDGLTLTINPDADLTAGGRYSLSVNARATTGQWLNQVFNFMVSGGTTGPSAPSDLARTLSDHDIVYSQIRFNMRWTAVDGATGYRPFMRSMGTRTTDWVALPAFEAPEGRDIIRFITAPDALLNVDGRLFDNGETVQVAVASMSGTSMGPLSSPVELNDEDCLSVVGVTQTRTFNTIGMDEPQEVVLGVEFNSVWDPETNLGLTLPGAVDESTFELLSLTGLTARYQGMIPANSDNQGDLELDLSALRDPSGNGACEGAETYVQAMF